VGCGLTVSVGTLGLALMEVREGGDCEFNAVLCGLRVTHEGAELNVRLCVRNAGHMRGAEAITGIT
jgi:hypothetical protein